MAAKDKAAENDGLQQVPEGDAAALVASQAARSAENFDPSGLVSDEEAARVAESFYRDEMEPGYSIQFQTRGGESVPIVRKVR